MTETPATMLACYYDAWGPADKVLKMGRLPIPKLQGPKDVLIKVYAASINPADYKQCEGELRPLLERPFPVLPGFDFSGVIIEKGSGVGDHLNPGDEVFGMIRGLRTGTTAEFVVVDEHVVSRKPASLTHQQAAGVPLAAITAFQCLLKAGLEYPANVTAKDKSVFVSGGPGGVGTFAIQIAKKMFGVGRVVTTASTAKMDLCKDLGADKVVDYKKEKFWEALKNEKFDVCVDCTGELSHMSEMVKPGGGVSTVLKANTGEMLQEWLAALGPNPGIRPYAPVKAVVSNLPPGVINIFTGAWWFKRKLPTNCKFASVITVPSREVLDKIAEHLENGDVRVVIDQVFPLDQAVDAYKRSQSGHAVGKVIVEVAQ